MPQLSVKNAASFLKPVILISIIMLVLGCSKADRELVGTWDNIKVPESVEFKPDGTGTFTYSNKQIPPLPFSWKHSVNNNFVLEVNLNGTRKTLTATVSNTNLTIESTVGNEQYRKQTSR